MINRADLSEKLKSIRDGTKNNRKVCAEHVFKCLNYERSSTIHIELLDKLLIWAIEQHFGKSTDSDILLVAFGLLEGYHYSQLSLGKRRGKYLAESNVMQTVLRVNENYSSASADRQKKLRNGNLRKAEDSRILDLTDFLAEYKIDEDKKVGDEANIVQLVRNLTKFDLVIPKPSYLLHKDVQSPQMIDNKNDNITDDGNNPDTDGLFQTTFTASDGSNLSQNDFPISQTDVIIPPVEEIFPTEKEIVLAPGEKFELKVAILPNEAANAPLSYVSLDTNIVTVSTTGILLARNMLPQSKLLKLNAAVEPEKNESSPFRVAEIVIQAESGASARKKVTVDFSSSVDIDPPLEDIENYEPDFVVNQVVRISGDKEWTDTLEAVEIGDKVEFRIEYRNQSQNDRHNDVMIKDILPKNLQYVPGTTKLINKTHQDGLFTQSDAVVNNGLNIGSYPAQSNAFVYFTAEVVDISLKDGANVLVNWSQCGVGQATLQDYVILGLNKE